MKTAEEVISILQEMPPEERQKVADFLNSNGEEFLYENYSEEDIAKLDKLQEEAEKGINMIGPFPNAEEAIAYLHSLDESS